MRSVLPVFLLLGLFNLIGVCPLPNSALADTPGDSRKKAHQGDTWRDLIQQAEVLGLPTSFLTYIPHDLVKIEFEGLRTFAAEYHPQERRMVLNRSLSLNRAGRTLVPLKQLTHQELSTLYHELFHAFLDAIRRQDQATPYPTRIRDFLAFAEDRQFCRYGQVLITPILQRKNFTEERILTEQEAWEALHETWAVFVGWAVWTKLELEGRVDDLSGKSEGIMMRWRDRLAKAHQEGSLTGYYEPKSPEERALTNKRFLATSFSISPSEVLELLKVVMEMPPEQATHIARSIRETRPNLKGALPCTRDVLPSGSE